MENLLDNQEAFKSDDIHYSMVSAWKRLANFLVDWIGIVIWNILFGILISYFKFLLGFGFRIQMGMNLELYLFLLFCFRYVLYYSLTEYFLKGKTLGKYLTNTRVITQHNEMPSFKICLLRSIIRLVPFEPFSFLGGVPGWHDEWSKTYVVEESEYRKYNHSL
ncbi:MAG: RDD family protein [Saprospiraceae bacterium]